jgi:hypothetical protein
MNPTQDNNNYPVFEANQVLTHVRLNEVFDYLDEQERLTRANLIGIGVVCGLEVTYENSVITISKGCGITSEGYLIVQPENITLTHYKNYFPPEDIKDTKYSFFVKKDNEEKEIDLQLQELIENNKNDGTALPLSNLDEKEKVLFLFLELKKDKLHSCTPNNCDDKGSKITVTVRPLLIVKTDLDNTKLEQTIDKDKLLSDQIDLPNLRLPRYQLSSDSSINSKGVLEAFCTVFKKTFKDKNNQDKTLVVQVGDALSQAYKVFNPLLSEIFPNDPFKSFETKFGFLDKDLFNDNTHTSQIHFLQYYYDFFDDLIQAYDEFRWKGITLLCSCCPSENLFPRHLILGSVTCKTSNIFSDNITKINRNYFIPSHANNCCEVRVKERDELILLFNRLVQMILQFTNSPILPCDDETNPKIRITPSKLGDIMLSDKAIPYYYQNQKIDAGEQVPTLFKFWNAEKTQRNRANQNLGYHSDKYPSDDNKIDDFTINLLNYDLESYNFLRIEGHLGCNYQYAVDKLSNLKKTYCLPIEIIALGTDLPTQNQRESLYNFLIKHPGIQHKAGVALGGTFILVYSRKSIKKASGKAVILENVIADFFLPYRVVDVIESQILTRECEYEWIDSIKHLNNLILRDYRPVATVKAPEANEKGNYKLDKNYIIRIYKYEIQGKSLLSGNNRDIKIPISDLKTSKLSAIARKLNETFPAGLVFDYKSNSNKILIRLLEGHDFCIELGGIQGNQIRYRYENNKVFRWQNKTWQEFGTRSNHNIICHISSGSGYKREDYEWLHENFKPKYPAPPINPTAKEVIQWEKITLERAPSSYREMYKLPIFSSVLRDVVKAILQIDSNAHIVLIGSWANGSWVSFNSEENPTTVEDPTVEDPQGNQIAWPDFLQLREKVTGKIGHSNIELLIDSEFEITADMIKVSTGYTIKLIQGKRNAQKGLVPFFLLTRKTAQGDMMLSGEVLSVNSCLVHIPATSPFPSPILKPITKLLFDGNKLLLSSALNYTNINTTNKTIWESTDSKSAEVCIMQRDGNLVIYGHDGECLWETKTGGNPDSQLVVYPNSVVIKRPDGKVIWKEIPQTNT